MFFAAPCPPFGGDVLYLGNTGVSKFAISPGTATATYTLINNGLINTNAAGNPENNKSWVTPNSHANLYEVRATTISGTVTSGTADGVTWQALSTNKAWSKTKSGIGIASCQVLLEIRKVGGSAILASATITLAGEVDSGA